MARAQHAQRSTPNVSDLHRQWLELVDTDGPVPGDPAAQAGVAPGHAEPVR